MRIPKTRHPFPFWQLTFFPKHVLILQREHKISDAAKFFKSLRRSFSSLRAEITYKLINTN